MELVSPAQIAEVLKIRKPAHFSEASLEQLVNHGLPKSTLDASLKLFSAGAAFVSLRQRIIPPATFKRRKRYLNADESSRVVRLARVFAMARYVWNSDDDAKTFLHTEHPLLEGRKPIEVAMTEQGARRVEGLLADIYFGHPA